VLIPRLTAIGGSLAVLATVVMIGTLDLTVGAMNRTISVYALGPYRWVFDSGVLLLAAGSAAILVTLVHKGLATWRSGGSAALLLWSAGLVIVVLFPKHNWAVGPSMSGTIHQFGSLLAFVSLPIAVLLLAKPHLRHVEWSAHARWTFGLGLLSVLAFMPLLYAIGLHVFTGVAWWRVFPLGYIERVLVVTEVVAVLVVGVWAVAASRVDAWRPGKISRTSSAASTK
jgi:hypothetical protein